MNKLLIVAIALIAAASFSALGISIVTASNSSQEKIGNVPGVIAYQGYLADGKNLPIVDGRHTLIFTIYEDATDSSPIWNEKQDVITSGGVFSAMLGSNTALSEDLFTSSIELHLGISVDGGNEALPRQRLASVPFAIVANKAKTATSALNLNCTGCVTADHLAADAKSSGGTATTTLTSPNGQFQVRVTNTGIFLEGPDSDYQLSLTSDDLTVGGNATQLVLENGDVTFTSTDDILLDAGGQMDLDSGSDLRIDVASKFDLNAVIVDVDSSTTLDLGGASTARLDGGVVSLGFGVFCKPASGIGDVVQVIPVSGAGTIVGGASAVLICN